MEEVGRTMAERLLLIRHGEIQEAGRGCYIGRTDLALSAEGRRQAACLTPVLASLDGARALSSPLERTRETAGIALGQIGRASWRVRVYI